MKLRTPHEFPTTKDGYALVYGQKLALDFTPQTRAEYLREELAKDPYGVNGQGIIGRDAYELDRLRKEYLHAELAKLGAAPF